MGISGKKFWGCHSCNPKCQRIVLSIPNCVIVSCLFWLWYDAKRLEGVPEPVHDEMPLFVWVKGKSRK